MLDLFEGVGIDAEIETNEMGGSESKAICAAHLLDPMFLISFTDDEILKHIARFMLSHSNTHLVIAIKDIARILNLSEPEILVTISKVLQEGAEKYGVNNWRLLPQETHINHAITHYLAYKSNDTQDEHLAHCMTRLMFAFVTEMSCNFDYTKFIIKD